MTPAALSPEKQLAGFIDKFDPAMAKLIRAARRKMRAKLPHAVELVYDQYNFLVIGYAPSERASEAVFSLASNAHGMTLFFLQGAGILDPKKLLRGSGKQVRSVRLESAASLDQAEIAALMKAALAHARAPMDPKTKHQLFIRSIVAKQRPRRKAGGRV